MKKCRKTQPEPDCLVDYRAANPMGTWDQFRQHARECYDTLRDSVRNDQGGLCAYCEFDLRRENEQLAHFHPKGDVNGSHNWALDWTNLWLACKGGSQTWMTNAQEFRPPLPDNLSCDEYKGPKVVDGDVFAPSEIPAFPRVFQFRQSPGAIAVCVDRGMCQRTGIDADRVERTITEFNLNCDRLMSARLERHRPLEHAIKKLRESGYDEKTGLKSLAEKHLAPDSDGRWPRFFTLVRWRLNEYAEAYLQSIGYDG